MSEIGNYFMVVTADGDGVMDRTFRDIANAAQDNFLIVFKFENAGVVYYPFISTLDVANLTVTFGEITFVATDMDDYPAISE